MKKCSQCGFAESDDARFCSSCGSSSFYYESAPGQYYAQPRTDIPSQGSSSRYILLAILTFFFPFIGGWFLIKPEVPSGYRNFAIVWCAFTAVFGIMAYLDDLVVALIVFILCFAPVAYFAWVRNRGANAQGGQQTPSNVDPSGISLEKFADKELQDLEEKYSDKY